MKRFLPLLAASLLVALGACSEAGGPDTAGWDTAVPVPLDRGATGGTGPVSYKGLALRLTDNGSPTVTPVDGVIGLVCVGMSNSSQECDAYASALRTSWSGEVNPQVRVVNCAVGSHAIERWNNPADDATLWGDCVDRKLGAGGVRPEQIRVLYHKAANQYTTAPGGGALPGYPDPASDYFAFIRNLSAFATRVPIEFPSVQAVYTSSRSYGGYAANPAARGEPLSYEEGHALNSWLATNRTVGGVWYGWGPYLWAPDCGDGIPNGSGVCYERSDYVADGVHPSASGKAKIARLIHDRLRREAWYRR